MRRIDEYDSCIFKHGEPIKFFQGIDFM